MERLYKPLVEQYLQYFPCVVLIGPRQCGKTTLMREIAKNWQFFDLENAADFDQISRDPAFFLRLHPEKIAIDEAQFCPNLFNALRVAIDESRDKKGRFLLSGSSSPALISAISESLAGRVGIIEMSPLLFFETKQNFKQISLASLLAKPHISLNEIEISLHQNTTLDEIKKYWLNGGYPEPWLAPNDKQRKAWMNQYVQTYVMRDISRLFPRIDQNRFRLFVQTLANLSGKVINLSESARSMGVSQPTVRDYFNIAHETFIWRNIPAFERDSLKRIVKHPKGYLRDSGLICHLLHIGSINDLMAHPQVAAIWESLVIEEIIQGLHALGIAFNYYYYRTSSGSEVDLVLEGEMGLVPIEIKMGTNIAKSGLKGLTNFIDERKCQFGLVISNDTKIRRVTEKVAVIPFAYC